MTATVQVTAFRRQLGRRLGLLLGEKEAKANWPPDKRGARAMLTGQTVDKRGQGA